MVQIYLHMPPSKYSTVCHIRCARKEGFVFNVKAKMGLVLCKSVGLVGIKTRGLVMAGPLGFDFKEYWLSGSVNCPFMWWKSPIMLGIDGLSWCLVLLGMTPLGHMA